MDQDETRAEQLVREFFETLSRGDLESLRARLHPEGSWEAMGTTIPGAGITRGRDAVIDVFLAPVRGLFEPGDPKVHLKRVFSKGDVVAAETEAIGMLRNGVRYHNRYAWIIEVKDDQVCHLREYMDTAYIMSVTD
jgi:ketosteroid isomerase-like protein